MTETPPARDTLPSFRTIAAVATLFYIAFVVRTLVMIDGKAYAVLFDDAMISMRYARHFADGAGLVWNVGDHPVQGFSNLLWTMIMAGPHAAGLPPRLASVPIMILGIAIVLGVTKVAWVLAREAAPADPAAAPLAAILVAGSSGLIFWSLRGMEAGAVALCAAAAVLMAVRTVTRGAAGAGTLAALAALSVAAVLLRHDAVLIPLAIAAWLFVNGRRAGALVVAASALGGLLTQLAFSFWYYGDPLPNTYYLKLAGVPLADRMIRGVLALALVTVRHVAPLLIFAFAALRGSRARAKDPLWLLAAIFGVCAAYSLYTGGDAWEFMPFANRFLVPGVVALSVAAAIGIARQDRRHIWTTAVLAIAAVQPAIWWACARFDRGIAREFVAAYRLHAAEFTMAAGALTAAIAALLLLPASRRGSWNTATVAGLVLVTSNGAAAVTWASANAPAVQMDAFQARLGVLVHGSTSPDATFAVTAAGTAPYLAERRAIDIRGKNDRRIARLAPVAPFMPGHNKWDLEYSVVALRADVACGLPMAPGQRDFLRAHGYVETPNLCFVRTASQRVGAGVFVPLRRGR